MLFAIPPLHVYTVYCFHFSFVKTIFTSLFNHFLTRPNQMKQSHFPKCQYPISRVCPIFSRAQLQLVPRWKFTTLRSDISYVSAVFARKSTVNYKRPYRSLILPKLRMMNLPLQKKKKEISSHRWSDSKNTRYAFTSHCTKKKKKNRNNNRYTVPPPLFFLFTRATREPIDRRLIVRRSRSSNKTKRGNERATCAHVARETRSIAANGGEFPVSRRICTASS